MVITHLRLWMHAAILILVEASFGRFAPPCASLSTDLTEEYTEAPRLLPVSLSLRLRRGIVSTGLFDTNTFRLA